MTGDELLDDATEPARVDSCGIELPNDVCPRQDADQQHRELGVLGAAPLTIGEPLEHGGQLVDDLGVERREALAELRPAEGGHADLGEQHAAIALGGQLDEEEVEATRERALGIEHLQLGAERRAETFDHLIDGRNQQIFLRDEVVVDEAGGKLRFRGDALHGRLGDTVLDDGRAETVDDLTTARSGQARASHK